MKQEINSAVMQVLFIDTTITLNVIRRVTFAESLHFAISAALPVLYSITCMRLYTKTVHYTSSAGAAIFPINISHGYFGWDRGMKRAVG